MKNENNMITSYGMGKKCFLCGSEKHTFLQKLIRQNGKNYDIDVIRCDECGLISLSGVFDDLNKFYANGGMYEETAPSLADLRRECKNDDERRFLFTEPFITNKDILDFGCGAGGYLTFAKNVANIAQGVELNNNNRKALVNEGFEIYKKIESIKNYDIITMFHVLEHLLDPIDVLKKLSEHLNDNGQIIIEVPNADDALLSLYKSKAFADFTYWICHVYLYNNETLKRLIKKAGLKINFIKQVQRYPLANHLYWLSHNKPGGHVQWSFMADDKELNERYGAMLANLGIADTIVVSVSK